MNKKIVWPKFQHREERLTGLLMTEGEKQEQTKELAADDLEKLIQIRELFGIEDKPGWELLLALELALEQRAPDKYVEVQKGGRPVVWSTLAFGCLVAEIDRIKVPNCRTKGVTWACNQLAKREPWKTLTPQNNQKDTVKHLRTLYYRHRKSGGAIAASKALEFHKLTNTIDDWDEMVLSIAKKPMEG